MTDDFPTRRAILATGVLAAGACSRSTPASPRRRSIPTPECHDGDAATLRQTEGPFFKPSSPERADLIEPGMAGQPIELVGFVLDARLQAGAGRAGRSVAGGRQGRLRQFRLPPARPPACRRRGALPFPHHRAGATIRAARATSTSRSQPPARAPAHHAALFPRRGGKPPGRPVPQGAVDTHRQERRVRSPDASISCSTCVSSMRMILSENRFPLFGIMR